MVGVVMVEQQIRLTEMLVVVVVLVLMVKMLFNSGDGGVGIEFLGFYHMAKPSISVLVECGRYLRMDQVLLVVLAEVVTVVALPMLKAALLALEVVVVECNLAEQLSPEEDLGLSLSDIVRN